VRPRPGILLAALCGILCGCSPYDAKSPEALANGYQAEFETVPPKNITVLQSRIAGWGDWGAQWLLLEARGDALESAILSRGFKRLKEPPSDFVKIGPNTPKWWRISPLEDFEFYENPAWTKGSFSSSTAQIAVNRTTGRVFLVCSRIN
jgi:hypothetical protein